MYHFGSSLHQDSDSKTWIQRVIFLKNLKLEKNVAVFEAFYPLNLSLFGVKRGFNCSIPFYKIHGYK